MKKKKLLTYENNYLYMALAKTKDVSQIVERINKVNCTEEKANL